jgi:hypothetical protein
MPPHWGDRCGTVTDGMGTSDDPVASGLVEHFPGSNPHPVLRVADDGRLTYANPASASLLESLGARVGEPLSPTWHSSLREAAQTARPIELRVGPGTFELLVVRLPDLGFLNVYGTDVTAARAVARFPDQNPNPVLRLDWEGRLVYANPASRQLIDGLGWSVGVILPAAFREPLLGGARNEDSGTTEVVSGERRYRLLAVDVPEFGFINVYGTDVTAAHDLEAAYRENERLLLNILPEPVAERLRRGERPIADRFDVKTIGDAYMVVGGMSGRTDHLDCLARMALSLGGAVQAIEAARQLGIEFRIGIHCGPVVAGVIGTRKFIYDIWGDTVNVASRMESTGVPGRIQVTAAVRERLHGAFEFEARGMTEVRGKGPMATYFLTGSRPGSAPAESATVSP